MLRFAHQPPTLRLGDLEVRRLGYGAMRLPGREVWGEPDDPATARAVLRRAIELGVNLIDTAWYYGPHTANRLIVEALHPYPSDVVIATKLGGKRNPDKSWAAALRPEELRAGVETDLQSLRLEQLPVVHLRWIEQREVTFAEALDALIDEKRAGRIRHLALSNVTVAQLDEALARTPIVAVQNVFNLAGPNAKLPPAMTAPNPEAVLDACEARGIAFLPFFPLAVGALAGGALDAAARRHNCTPAQLALAWLLARSPVMVPIPGTSKVAHLEENIGAIHIALDRDAMQGLAPNG